jgi:hypothetical protein
MVCSCCQSSGRGGRGPAATFWYMLVLVHARAPPHAIDIIAYGHTRQATAHTELHLMKD